MQLIRRPRSFSTLFEFVLAPKLSHPLGKPTYKPSCQRDLGRKYFTMAGLKDDGMAKMPEVWFLGLFERAWKDIRSPGYLVYSYSSYNASWDMPRCSSFFNMRIPLYANFLSCLHTCMPCRLLNACRRPTIQLWSHRGD